MNAATILIVDDEPANLSLLTHLLRPVYKVRAANSGENALRAAASVPRPDLVLLDVMMADMDGVEVLARLRNNPATADIPVIFVTALSDVDDEERGLALGAADYITKPIKPAVVLARVRTQLEAKHTRDWLKDKNAILEAEVSRRMAENDLTQLVSIRALAHLAEADGEQPIDFLVLAKEIAHWHHEKWDGSGYPDGLKGEKIPASARLMAVADVFDALISPRVYKPAMSYQEAREIISAGSGCHFDPDMVSAFLEDFDAMTAIADQYQDRGNSEG